MTVRLVAVLLLQECRVALIDELMALAREIATPGSKLNKLVTRT